MANLISSRQIQGVVTASKVTGEFEVSGSSHITGSFNVTGSISAVSYTHLTLPTILRV